MRYIKLYEEINFQEDWEDEPLDEPLLELSEILKISDYWTYEYVLVIFEEDRRDDINYILSKYEIEVPERFKHNDGKYYVTIQRSPSKLHLSYWSNSDEQTILEHFEYEKIIRFSGEIS